MEKSKIIALLKTFSAKELRDFRDFVQSPYINKQEDVSLLYEYLYAKSPHFKNTEVKRESVYKSLYGTGKFNQKYFYYLSSNLLKLAERFIMIEQVEKEETISEYYTMKSLLNRKLTKHYQERLRQMEKKLEKYKSWDVYYYWHKFLISDLENRKYLQSNVRAADTSLQHASDYFDIYFLCRKLRYTCEMLDRNITLKSDFNIGLFEEMKKHFYTTSYEKIPVLHAYIMVFFMLINPNDNAHFYALKEILHKAIPSFNKEILKELFEHAINYCLRQTRKGNIAFHDEALQLYILGIDMHILIDRGHLSPWNFKNVIQLGLNLKRYDWTEKFIRTYNEKLSVKFRNDALNFNLANLFYHTGEWNHAIDHLNLVRFSDISYSLGTRFLLCKIYYQSEAENALYSLIASFRIFLRRQKTISEELRNAYLNYLQFVNVLLKTSTPEAVELRKKIESTKVLMAKSWLLEMADKKIRNEKPSPMSYSI